MSKEDLAILENTFSIKMQLSEYHEQLLGPLNLRADLHQKQAWKIYKFIATIILKVYVNTLGLLLIINIYWIHTA